MGDPGLDSLARCIEELATTHSHAPAVLTEARVWTWLELRTCARSYASQLAGPRGTTDVVYLPAGGEALAILAACEEAGVHAILVAPPYTEARAREVRAMFGARRVIMPVGDAIHVLAEDEGASAPTPGAPTLLVLTSGTTGTAKCAVHTWATLSASVKRRPVYADRRWLIAYPLSHFAALQVLVQCVFTRGVLVIPRDFSAPAGVSALRDQHVSYLCATPTYVRQLLRASSPDDWQAMMLDHVTLGGEIVDQPLLDALRQRRPGIQVVHTYASTELGAVLSVRDGRAGFDAALLDDRALAIRDGQLFVRRSSRAMLRYAAGDDVPEDAWVATGDLVEVEADRVFFRGRTKDVINVGGFKVFPSAVEVVVREVPGVRDVVVVGRKSSITGHLVKALVWAEDNVDRPDLQRAITCHCAERLPAHMVPRLIEFREQLERSEAQKLVR